MKTLLTLSTIALASALTVAAPTAQAGYTTTKHPILLVHGILGFSNFWGADYFYQIPSTLKSEGAKVHVATVSAVGSSELRGEQLIQEMLTLKAINGYSKFNLIGHSQGSPTSRYAAAVRPDLVASVTSVNGVNKGSRVADVVRKVAPAGTVTSAVFALSKKERVVAQHIVTGASNQEIAETLCVSLSTIKTHTQNIYSKLGVNKRLQAIEMLLKLNLAS